MKTLLAIDQGTTSSRAILFDESGNVVDVEQKELKLFYPHKGWVEQDAKTLWEDTLFCVRSVLDRAKEEGRYPIAAGVTAQRETTVIWDKNTGEPVYNAIVWQDRRTSERCADLKSGGHEVEITRKTGLLLDPYFSATKAEWILDNVDGARKRAQQGDLLFGTIDCWLLWNFTNGRSHCSDVTNASRTLLYNIAEQKWDEDLLRLFNIPFSLLPEVRDNVSDFGIISADIAGEALPIFAMAGDQQAALIGQGCFESGMVKSTYGTGCFALMNIGADFKVSRNRLLTTPAYRIDGKITYAVEGSIFVAGAAVQWLRDGLCLFENAAESEALATSVDDNGGVYFVPAFTGLGAPYWEPSARALIAGMGRESTRAHIVRAALEAQAYQTLDLMHAMIADGGYEPEVIRVDGGLVSNEFVCQFLADILQRRIEVPRVQEATAWGSAALAGLKAGVFSSLDDIAQQWEGVRIYNPKLKRNESEQLYAEWKAIIGMLLPSRERT